MKQPLDTQANIDAWRKKHGLTLPPSYVRYVTTVGARAFKDFNAVEGLDVKIVPTKDLDAQEYRRDDDGESPPEPDGLMFAVLINGDVLCFDLRTNSPEYPVYHFDHETETFAPFAHDFAGAVRRLVERA